MERRDRPPRAVPWYVLTGGTTDAGRHRLRPETLLRARVPETELGAHVPPEQRRLVALCRPWLSLAEVASYVEVPLTVAAALAAQAITHDWITAEPPPRADRPDLDTMQRVLDGLQRL
ncbi:DUF742 domain-containing protein [Saccharothrix sp. AJ9571]|nr:DUF742 domain-containing protein [Saccharothrix sp. AJ9571]